MKTGMFDRCYRHILDQYDMGLYEKIGLHEKAKEKHQPIPPGKLREALEPFITYVDISKPAHWLLQDQSKKCCEEADFPSALCPWPWAWFEYTIPPNSFLPSNEGDCIGFFCETRQLSDETKKGITTDPTAILPVVIKSWDMPSPSDADPVTNITDPEFSFQWAMFFEQKRRAGIASFTGSFVGCIGKDGRRARLIHMFFPRFGKNDSDNNEIQELLIPFVYPLEFSISLLHCKNVQAEDNPIPKEIIAKREKRNHFGGVTYKTLDITPIRKLSCSERTEGETSIDRALHICRGHFRTYSDDRPLFGRLSGTFWVPMHTRGDIKHGEIRKDYRIKR